MTGEKRSVRGRRDQPRRIPPPSDSFSGSEDGYGYFTPMSLHDRDSMNAKMFLLTQTDPDQPCLFDHLARLITEILDKKPDNALRFLEDISRDMKRDRIHIPTHSLRDQVPKTHAETIANAQWKLLKKCQEPMVPDVNVMEEEDKLLCVPDIMRQAAYFEMAGVGLPREEFLRISLSLQDLVDTYPTIQVVRFWGKILGVGKNYYIAEVEFGEHDYVEDVSDNEVDDDDMINGLTEEDSALFDDILLPGDLKPDYKPPPKVPCEAAGTGLNKKVYYVTPEPGLPWVRLPHVTPAQIQAARRIRKFFSGDLNAQVISYPPFPGVEKNYLRAQIARISASTHVSPIGYFRFDDELDEEEEVAEEAGGGGRNSVITDLDFEGLAVKDLADASLQAWVHHLPAILQQGRTTWWNPVQPREEFNEEEEGEDEDEERNEPDEPEPETGPPLLTPLSEDENVGVSPPWIPTTSSKFVPEYSIAVMQSNVWLGAVAYAAEKGLSFENMYIGWGQKNLANDFDPALPEVPMIEFPSGPEITEADDPSPEEEAAVRAAQHEKELEAEFEQNLEDDDDDVIDDDAEGGEEFDEE